MIVDKINQIKTRFDQYSNWEDKYRELIQIGKELDQLSEDFHIEKFKVKGCQSQVWLKPSYSDGLVKFRADSDAVLVRGIVGLIIYVFSDETPETILSTKPDFLKEIGITEHLSMNRTNGLASMLKQVQMYAMAFKTLADQGVDNADNF